MRTFPNTEFYLVNYFPGSSGTFLQSLLAILFYNKRFYSFSKNGNAVNSINHWFLNERFDIDGVDDQPIYKNVLNIIPNDSKRPVFSRSHQIPNIDILLYKYPKTKHIIITLDSIGKQIAALQDFNKNFKEMHRLGPFSNAALKWKDYSIKYFNSIEYPKNVTDDMLKKYCKNLELPPYDNLNIGYEHAFKIALTDIYFKIDYTLDLMSTIVNKPINDFAKDYYKKYIDKQYEKIAILELGNSYI